MVMVQNGIAIRMPLVRRGSDSDLCRIPTWRFCQLANCSPLFAMSAGLSAHILAGQFVGVSVWSIVYHVENCEVDAELDCNWSN